MKVFKPAQLGILTRSFEHERRFQLGVCALAFVPLGPDAGGPVLLPEPAMWKLVAEALGDEGTLDATIPKVRSEYLVHGSAHAKDGVAVARFAVRAEIGGLAKDLSITGDRMWAGARPTEPRPISQMRLSWTAAFGGDGDPRNPLGKGAAEIEVGGTPGQPGIKARPLPNIEDPRALVTRPADKPEPAGLGQVDISWPQRAALAGTYDQRWLQTLYPGFAANVDWGLHNVAPADQQRRGDWSPGEAYRFINLHPTRPVLEGTLPDLAARMFVVRSHRIGQPRPSALDHAKAARATPADDAPPLEEVKLRLQTLFFFPEHERAVLAWTGVVDVAEEDAADIVQLMVAADNASNQRPVAHYRHVLAARTDDEYGALASLRDDDLIPVHLAERPTPPGEDTDLAPFDGIAIDHGHRHAMELYEAAQAHLQREGIDPALVGLTPPPPPDPKPALEDLPELLAEKRAQADAAKLAAEKQRDQTQAEAVKKLEAAGDPTLTPDAVLGDVRTAGQGPPQFTAAGQKARLEQIALSIRASGQIDDQIEALIADQMQFDRWLEVERTLMDVYRRNAHLQAPAPAMPPELAEPTRARLRQALADGEDLGTLNFTGADLRGIDLRGADLSRGLFEGTNLSGADLRDTKLDDAVLARANLDEVRLDGASMRRTNLGRARGRAVGLARADMRDAVADESELQGASMPQANLVGASLRGIQWRDCDAAGADFGPATFIECELSVDFTSARLAGATFVKLDLRGCKFDRAILSKATLLTCNLTKVSAAEAKLGGIRVVEGSRFDDAVLARADLTRANFRGTSMFGVDLRFAVLDDADLTEANLQGAKLYRAVARRARFDIANLRGADLSSANFMEASFARATIEDADLRGSNLYGVDMARVRTNARVRTDGALLSRVRIHPRHEPARS